MGTAVVAIKALCILQPCPVRLWWGCCRTGGWALVAWGAVLGWGLAKALLVALVAALVTVHGGNWSWWHW